MILKLGGFIMQQEFEYLLAVYRAGSFTRAAENLHLTQPALSMAIKKLESSIGMTLFDRSTRPLELTDAGRAYLEGILEIALLEWGINAKIRDLQDLKTGDIHIGGSHFINTCILPDVMTKYSRKYPGINIKLTEAGSDVLAEMLNDRMIDLTFSCREDIIANFGYRPAFSDHILLAVSRDIIDLSCGLFAADIIAGLHLDEEYPCIYYSDMSSLEYILLSEGNNLHDRAMKIFAEAGITPRVKLEISQLSTSYHLAQSNFGAAFVSDRMVSESEYRLKYYKIRSPLTDRKFYSVLPKREYTPKTVHAFIDMFSSVVWPSLRDIYPADTHSEYQC